MEVDEQDYKVKLEIKEEHENNEDQEYKEICNSLVGYVKEEKPELTSLKAIITTVGSENEFVLGIDATGGVDSEIDSIKENETVGKGVIDSEIDDIKEYKFDFKGLIKSERDDTKEYREQRSIKPENGDQFDDKSIIDIDVKDCKEDPFLWCLKSGVFKTVKEEICLNEIKERSPPLTLKETSQGNSTENEESCSEVNFPDIELEDENTQESSNNISSPASKKTRKKYFKPLKYICPYCDKKFPQSDILRYHVMRHTGEKPLECHFCCKRFISKNGLNLHLQTHTAKRFPCKVCNQGFANNTNLKLHMLIHENKRGFKCNLCPLAFNKKEALVSHITRVHNKKENGTDKADTNTEYHKEPLNNFECYHCKKKFASRESVRSHILYVHMENKKKSERNSYCCKICGVKSSKIYCLDHTRIHKSHNSFTCSVCKLHFTERKSFRKHIENIHPTDKPYGCSFCNASFKERGNLNIHIEVHHTSVTKKFVCNICNMSFNRETYLKRHQKIHTKSDRTFSCNLCPVKCRSKSDIRRHLATHLGTQEKPHKCEHCDKSFEKPSKLVRHQIVHSGEKPFKCNLCEKSYGDESSLKLHQNSHEGITYTCNICGFLSVNERSFKRHISQTICQKKSFICEVCGKTLTTEKYYKNHMIKFHSEDS